jgi:shikimate kinase
MKTNLALIGFMGTGKTAVGRLLADKLGMNFIEMDAVIEMKAKKTIPQIFEEGGEIAFRELEIEVTRAVAQETRAVVACGGGLVLNRINVDRLRQGAVMINLTASPIVTLRRISRQAGQRPLLDVQDPLGTIREMLRARKQLYLQAADITVNTSRLNTEAVTDVVITELRKDESFDWPK